MRTLATVHDLSTQFDAATIRQRRLFESGASTARVRAEKKFSEKVNDYNYDCTRIVYYCSFALQEVASELIAK